MTQSRDIERLLDAWLAEGPLQVPDRVFDDAVVRLRREPARRAWHLPWRNHEMTMPIRLTAAAVAIVATVGVGLALDLTSDSGPRPSSSPTASPAATSTPSLPPITCLVDGAPKEPCLGRLAAGTYTLDSPLVPFSVTVPDGWQNPMNILGGATFERQGDSSGAAIYVWPDPVIANQQTCVSGHDSRFGRSVDDIAEFLRGHPGLDVSFEEQVNLGGLSGWVMRLRNVATAPPCSTEISLFVHEGTIADGFWWTLLGGRTMAIWLLEAGDGHTVLVNIESTDADFEEFADAAAPIVESMQFTRQAQCVDDSACLGMIEAGTYTTGALEVPLTFTVPEGWANDWDVPLGYALIPLDAEAAEPGIFVFLDVYASNQSACIRQPAPGVGRAAADLVAWLGTLPDVTLTPPAPVTVGGLSGTQVDVSVASGGPVCSPNDYQLWVSDYGPLWWGLTPGHPQRHYLLDLPGRHNALIVVPAAEAAFEAFVTRAEPIIESFDFDV